MALSTGTLLNHYRLGRVIGTGGMGEVYEAEDLRLKRLVAIKVLPGAPGDDPSRYARFEREAQILASLNHPNIVTIHSVEETGGMRFITMERLEGQTLAQSIPPDGLPLQHFHRIALPLLDAVGAAHEQGIVHRDLKPGNVMVDAAGRVKVLDFGLAKLVDARPASDAATVTGAAPLTVAGGILGTVAYMSPEQARGRAGDHRSDIFSLGVVLYEMATGRRPFGGESDIDILSSIVRDVPSRVEAIRPGLPAALGEAIDRCLAKDPDARYASVRALAFDVQSLAQAPQSGRPAARAGRFTGRALAAAGLVLTATIGVYLFTRLQEPQAPGTPTFSRVTFGPAIESWPSLSPDGNSVVYASNESGDYDVHLKGVGDENVRNLTSGSTANDTMPAFSPDGRHIAFVSSRDGGGVFVMTRSGESVRRLTPGGFDPTWSPDGTQVLYSLQSGFDPEQRFAPGELWAVDVRTERTRLIAPADAVAPRVSPDGRLVAYWSLPVSPDGRTFASGNRDIWVRPVAGGAAVRVTDAEGLDWDPLWAADGRSLFFSSDRGGTLNLWNVAVDPGSGRPLGRPTPVTTPAEWAGYMDISADGRTIAYAAYEFGSTVGVIPFDPDGGSVGGPPRKLVTGARAWLQPDVSPDGRHLVMRSSRSQEDIWLVDTDGSGLRKLTDDAAMDRVPRWVPGGRATIFYSNRGGGPFNFWMVNQDGSGLRQVTRGINVNYPVPSPDGMWLGGSNPNTRRQFLFDAHAPSTPPRVLPSPPDSASAIYLNDWSPDGQHIAAHESPSGGLWMFTLGAERWQRVTSQASYPRWLPDSRRLLAPRHGRIVLVDTRTQEVRDVYGEDGRRIGFVAPSRDARLLYYTSSVLTSDIWLMRFPSR